MTGLEVVNTAYADITDNVFGRVNKNLPHYFETRVLISQIMASIDALGLRSEDLNKLKYDMCM